MAEQKKCSEGDVIELGPPVADAEPGTHVFKRHTADHEIQIGVGKLEPISQRKEGKPFAPGEILCRRRDDGRFNVEQIMPGSSESSESGEASGPAMVTSDAYRTGWDAIFGKATVGKA